MVSSPSERPFISLTVLTFAKGKLASEYASARLKESHHDKRSVEVREEYEAMKRGLKGSWESLDTPEEWLQYMQE